MPRAAQISRSAVLDAAFGLADDEGLPAVTMRAVAGRLGVTPMALYRHVRDKDELLDGLVELLLSTLPTPADGTPWEEQLAGLADGIRRTARAHPAVFGLLLTRPAATAPALRVRDSVLAILRATGQPPELVPRLERLLTTFVLGFAISESSGRFTGRESAVDDDFRYAQDLVFSLLRAGPDGGGPGGR